MINEAAYIEALKNCQKWNAKHISSRVNVNQRVFDQQTGIVQRPADHLYRSRLERCTPSNPLQVVSYPAKRYKRSKEISSEACEMSYIRQAYPEINKAIFALTDPIANSSTIQPDLNEPTPMPLRSSTNNNGNKTNYEGFDDMLDYEFEIDNPSDEDDWGSRRRRKKAKQEKEIGGGGGSGRSRRSAAVNSSAAAASSSSIGHSREPSAQLKSEVPDASEPRPFVCQTCGARYKSRPGLSYHKLHVHKEEALASEIPKSSPTNSC